MNQLILMVLFDFDFIMKNKYDKYINLNLNLDLELELISFDSYKKIGLEKIKKIFEYYFTNLNLEYIDNLLKYKKMKILFSCSETKFNIKNIKSILIYLKTKSNNCIKYYIFALGTHYQYRKFGYGKILLDEFVQMVKQSKTKFNRKILLKSVESSLNFYLTFGFVQTELEPNKLFYKFEPVTELRTNKNKLLEYNII